MRKTTIKFECSSCGEKKLCMAYVKGPPICEDCFSKAVHITTSDDTVLVKFAQGSTEYMPPGTTC